MCQTVYRGELIRVQLPTSWTSPNQMWRWIRLLSTGAERTGYSGASARAFPQGDRRHPLRFAHRLPMESTADMLRLWFYCPPPLPAVGALWDHRRHCEDMIDWYERRRGVDWEW